MVDLKILQSEWLRAFLPKSQEQDLFQIEGLCGNTANSIKFHYRTNSGKINDRFFLKKFKKPYFGPFFAHFLNVLEQKSFPKKSGTVRLCLEVIETAYTI